MGGCVLMRRAVGVDGGWEEALSYEEMLCNELSGEVAWGRRGLRPAPDQSEGWPQVGPRSALVRPGSAQGRSKVSFRFA